MEHTSEGPTRINRAVIESAWKRHRPDLRLVIRDSPCRGLSLVVNGGSMAWRFEWRPRGLDPQTGKRWPSTAFTLGTPDNLSADGARHAAGRLKGEARAGVDIAEQRRRQRTEANRRRASTVNRLVEIYGPALTERPKLRGTGTLSPDSANAELAHLRLAIGRMDVADLPISDVGVPEITKLLTARAAQPATARKHFGALSRFLDWAMDQGHIDLNPANRLPKSKRPRAVRPRRNCPSPADLAALWQAAERVGYAAGGAAERRLSATERDLVRFLIAVPCRLREGTRLGWEHLDLPAATWRLPPAMTKHREGHDFHLNALALALLKERWVAARQPTDGLVFPAQRGRPIETFTDIKAYLRALSGVRNWTFHDNRRAFASACAEHGVDESVADLILSHRQSATRGGVLGVYQKASRRQDQVRAMQVWSDLMAEAIRRDAAAATEQSAAA